MTFGIAFANTLQFTERDGLETLARSAESAGFDSLWTVEHVIYPDGYQSEYPYDRSGKMAADASSPIPDPLIWLSFVAAATTTMRLGTGILILPQRNPLILAKEVATLDRLSGGRVELGIGVGWLREEFDALGVDFERRNELFDEALEVLRGVWTTDAFAYEGSGFTAGGGVTYRGQVYLNNTNTQTAPANVTFDAMVSHQIRPQLRAQLRPGLDDAQRLAHRGDDRGRGGHRPWPARQAWLAPRFGCWRRRCHPGGDGRPRELVRADGLCLAVRLN